MDKQYLETRYKAAAADWRMAATPQARQQATDRMARLERLAMESQGFDFADFLHGRYAEPLQG